MHLFNNIIFLYIILYNFCLSYYKYHALSINYYNIKSLLVLKTI